MLFNIYLTWELFSRDVVRVWFANRRQKQKKQPSSPEIDFSNIQNFGDFFDDFDDPASDYDDFPGIGYQAGQKASVIVLNNSGSAATHPTQDTPDPATDFNDFINLWKRNNQLVLLLSNEIDGSMSTLLQQLPWNG